MNRRAALAALLASAMVREAPGQSPGAVRKLGYLARVDDGAWLLPALASLGHVQGRNLDFVVRRAEDGSPTDAAAVALVRERVDVLLAYGNARVLALKRATSTIPIVAGEVSDAVALGLAQSIRRPGGNVTGVSYSVAEAADGGMAILKTLLPRMRRIVVVHPSRVDPNLRASLKSVGEAAARFGIAWEFAAVDSYADHEKSFAGIRKPEEVAAWIIGHPNTEVRKEITALFKRLRVAAVGGGHEDWVIDGALVSYLRVFADPRRTIAAILDKVLRGANPAEIPFEVPDRVEMFLNRTTARTLGITIPDDIAVRVTDWVD
jgi:putative tryptophan/tyrosine transport system substrate-binding protein